MKNQSPGALVISLDFELIWGVFDVIDTSKCDTYFRNTRKIIPEILQLFEKKGIHATWATVGMLFNETWAEWDKNIPKNIPDYANPALSAYEFGHKYRQMGNPAWCFAPELIKLISRCPGQELGTHTYSHYYCQEPGQELADFREDLLKSIELAGNMDIELKSLVFPRNQINREYLEICNELGIKNVRSNPGSWYWKNARSESIITKIARTGDAYLPFGKKSYNAEALIKAPGIPLEQIASRFLRPVETNKVLNKLKISRIKNEMLDSAKKGEVYHLWWHPHNFGTDPHASMQDLKLILQHYQKLNEKYNFQSINMDGVGNLLIN